MAGTSHLPTHPIDERTAGTRGSFGPSYDRSLSECRRRKMITKLENVMSPYRAVTLTNLRAGTGQVSSSDACALARHQIHSPRFEADAWHRAYGMSAARLHIVRSCPTAAAWSGAL